MKRTSITLVCCLLTASAAAIELPDTRKVPGGVAVVVLDREGQAAPRVSFQGNQVMVVRDGGQWLAVVGLPLTLAPGDYRLESVADGQTRTYPIHVADKQYPVQRLTIKNRRKVYPNKEDMKRIDKEREEIGKAFSVWSYDANPPLRFDLPAYGRFSSRFGLKRFYNESPRPRRHSALDIAAPTGTPVYAPARATVISIGDYYFTGNTIFLDHGQGLLSQYIHLSKIDVKPGAVIPRGHKIGEVGATGRVTGPHLHWAMILNRTMVDPLPFVRSRALIRNQAYVDRIYKETTGGVARQDAGGS